MFLFLNLPWKAALDFTSALVAVGIVAIISRHVHTKSGRYFMLAVLGAGEFAAAVGMEVLVPTLAGKIFWGKMQYVGLALIIPAWFLFVAAYTRQPWMSRRVEISVWFIPMLTLLAVWTNQYHHLYWLNTWLLPYAETAVYEHGFFFWVFATYHYSLAVLGFLLAYWQTIKQPQLYRHLALAFTISAFPATLSNVLYLIDPYRYPLSVMVTVPILVSAPILAWAFFSRPVFALRPVAYHLFFRQNADAGLMVNADGFVVDANARWLELSGYALDEIVGKPVSILSSSPWDVVLQKIEQREYGRIENISIETGSGEPRFVAVQILPIYEESGQYIGVVITGRDITAEEEARRQIEIQSTALERNLRHVHLLYEVSQVAASQTEPEVLARAIGERVRQALEVQAVYVAFYEKEKGLITIPYWNLDGEATPGPTLRYGEGITSYVIRTRQPLIIDENFSQRGEQYNVVHIPPDKVAKTWAGVPIIVAGETIGVISIQDYEKEHAFTPRQIDILTTVAATLGVALANARLSAALQKELDEMERISRELARANERLQIQAVRDPLTNLFNRRYLSDRLEEVLAVHRHNRRTLCVVMLDIDHFKRFNDTYGHDIGDVLLKGLGEILLIHTRKTDIPCRYGGEEFLVVLSDVKAEQAVRIAEKWRSLFSQVVAPNVPPHENPTLSAGISMFPKHSEDGATLISMADQALYRAKQSGRDCVVVYERALPAPRLKTRPLADSDNPL